MKTHKKRAAALPRTAAAHNQISHHRSTNGKAHLQQVFSRRSGNVAAGDLIPGVMAGLSAQLAELEKEQAEARIRCLVLLEEHLGADGAKLFLNRPQPALDNRTGAELLKYDPLMLLERVELLEGKAASQP